MLGGGEGVHIQIMYYTSSTIARTPDIFEIDSTGLHWYETCSIVYCTRVCSWTPPQHPPDIIHMIDVPSPFLYFASLPLPCMYYTEHKPKGGGLGMRPVTNIEPLNLLTNVKAITALYPNASTPNVGKWNIVVPAGVCAPPIDTTTSYQLYRTS